MINTDFTDEELISLINSGSQSAEVALYERYFRYSRVLASDYIETFDINPSLEEELTAVIFSKFPIILQKADKIGTAFNLYWKASVRNLVYDYIEELKQPYPLYSSQNVSFDEYAFEDEKLTLHDVLGDDDQEMSDVDSPIFGLLKDLIEKENSPLNENEKKVAKLMFFEELDARSIAEKLGWKRDHTNYVIRSAKDKIIKIIKHSYL